MMTELWKPIPNLPYEVSNLGNVRNLQGKLMKIVRHKGMGFARVDLWHNNKRICRSVEVLLRQVWGINRPSPFPPHGFTKKPRPTPATQPTTLPGLSWLQREEMIRAAVERNAA